MGERVVQACSSEKNLTAAVIGITEGAELPSSFLITCQVSSTGLPTLDFLPNPDPSAELVGVRVTRWERHYPDLILSNLRHLKHIQGPQPSCFQFKAVLAELASSCCNTNNANRKKNKILEGFEPFLSPAKFTALQ